MYLIVIYQLNNKSKKEKRKKPVKLANFITKTRVPRTHATMLNVSGESSRLIELDTGLWQTPRQHIKLRRCGAPAWLADIPLTRINHILCD